MHVFKSGNTKTYFGPVHLLWIASVATWKLAQAALQAPTDVFHLGKPHPMNGVAALIARRVRGCRLFLDCDDSEATSNRFTGEWQRRGVGFFESYLPRACGAVTVNTRSTFERIRQLGLPTHRVVYVPNGVDRDRFAPVSEQTVEQLRAHLGLSQQRIVLYLGSLSLTSHAVDLLIDAFALVRKAAPDAILLLVGSGEDYDGLRAQTEALDLGAAVRFAGRVPPAEAPKYYALADVSVDPVKDDEASRGRCPLKIIESLAMGTPVVTGAVGDRAELLAQGGGIVVPAGDARHLAEALLSVLLDPAKARQLKVEALASRDRYYCDQLIRDFACVYDL
jgi:glycosyltransferase involved in cell wall biosynthesis